MPYLESVCHRAMTSAAPDGPSAPAGDLNQYSPGGVGMHPGLNGSRDCVRISSPKVTANLTIPKELDR